MNRTHASLACCMLALALAGAPARADDDCNAPVQRWQSRDAVRQMAAQRGWKIQRLKIDDGCYEIRGTDADGRAFKGKVDPETLQVVKLEHRERDRGERRRERQDQPRSAGPAASAASAAAAAPGAPVFTPGTAPRGRIE